MFNDNPAIQPATKESFSYAEYAFAVYPNKEGTVTIEQDQPHGFGGNTVIVTMEKNEVREFVAALRNAQKAVTDKNMESGYELGETEVYVSENGNVCIRPVSDEEKDIIIVEPYRVEAMAVALQKAAAELR